MQEQSITSLCGELKSCSKWSSTEARNGLSVLQKWSRFMWFPSQLQTAIFPLLCDLALPSGLWLPCLLLRYSRTGKKNKNKNGQIHAHVTAPISEGRYVRATMCSHYLVTVLCWAYSNWVVFPSCKMKTPCLLSVTTTSVFCSLWLSYFLGLADLSPSSGDRHRHAETALVLLLVRSKLQENRVWHPLCPGQLVNQSSSLVPEPGELAVEWWEVWGAQAGVDTSSGAAPELVPCLAHLSPRLPWAGLPGTRNAAQEGQEVALGSRMGCGLLCSRPAFSTSCRC